MQEVLKIILKANHIKNIDLDSGELTSIKSIAWNAKEEVFIYKSITKDDGTKLKKHLLLENYGFITL